jgi:7,8-dihydroneopterin aldolase/epimerase/oxygenase
MDKLIISQLELNAIIGIHPHERVQKQPIILDLELDYDSRLAARSDQISDALDYSKIANRIQEFVIQSQFFLIETLANQIADILLTEFGVKKLRLVIQKPNAIPQAKYAGLMIERVSV